MRDLPKLHALALALVLTAAATQCLVLCTMLPCDSGTVGVPPCHQQSPAQQQPSGCKLPQFIALTSSVVRVNAVDTVGALLPIGGSDLAALRVSFTASDFHTENPTSLALAPAGVLRI